MNPSTIYSGPAVHYRQLTISSPAFQNNEMIPAKYTCDGLNISPPLDIEQIPKDAKSFVLIVDDPDAANGPFVHWIVWNIPVKHHLHENEVHGIEGLNDSNQHHYSGPCPPRGTHRYYFKIYALDSLLELPPDTRKETLEQTMSEYIVAFGELIGIYQRQ